MSTKRITNLPFDIHIEVCLFLDPVDIMALGLTCMLLHSVCSRHSVWKEALLRVISRNVMFFPTFLQPSGGHLESMTVVELQYASTAPARMLRLLEDKQLKKYYKNRVLKPLYTFTVPLFQEDTPEVDTPEWETEYAYVVPGGRYVVSTSSKRLMVVDLDRFFRLNIASEDQSDAKATGPDPAAYIAYYRCLGGYIVVGPSKDGTKLRIAISVSGPAGMLTHDICEYDPAINELYHLRKVSFLYGSPRLSSRSPCLSGNFFAWISKDLVYVCNFVSGLCVSWEVEDDFEYIIFAGEKIVLVGEEEVGVWDIPPELHAPVMQDYTETHLRDPIPPDVTGFTIPCIENRPLTIMQKVQSFGKPSHKYVTTTTSDICMDNWYYGEQQSPMFDALCYMWDDRDEYRARQSVAFRQQLPSPAEFDADESDESGDSDVELEVTGCFALMDFKHTDNLSSRISEGRTVLMWEFTKYLYMLVTPGPVSGPLSSSVLPLTPKIDHAVATESTLADDPEISPNVAVEIDTAGEGQPNCSFDYFDPLSGRLCGTTDGRSIVVCDFLRLPRSMAEGRYGGMNICTNGPGESWEKLEEKNRQWRREREERDVYEDETDDETWFRRSSIS